MISLSLLIIRLFFEELYLCFVNFILLFCFYAICSWYWFSFNGFLIYTLAWLEGGSAGGKIEFMFFPF